MSAFSLFHRNTENKESTCSTHAHLSSHRPLLSSPAVRCSTGSRDSLGPGNGDGVWRCRKCRVWGHKLGSCSLSLSHLWPGYRAERGRERGKWGSGCEENNSSYLFCFFKSVEHFNIKNCITHCRKALQPFLHLMRNIWSLWNTERSSEEGDKWCDGIQAPLVLDVLMF